MDQGFENEIYFCPNVPCSYSSGSPFYVQNHIKRCRFRHQNPAFDQGLAAPVLSVPKTRILGGDIQEQDVDNGYFNECPDDVCKIEVPEEIKKFAETVNKIAIKGCGKEISELLKMMCEEQVSIQDLKSYVPNLDSAEKLASTTNHNELLEEGFKKIQIPQQTPDLQCSSVFYSKDVVKILQKQVEVALENDFLFRCEQENLQGAQEFKKHPM